MHVFVERVFEKIVDFKICPKRFDILKEKYGRMLKNYKTRPLYTLTGYYLNLVTCVSIFLLFFCCFTPLILKFFRSWVGVMKIYRTLWTTWLLIQLPIWPSYFFLRFTSKHIFTATLARKAHCNSATWLILSLLDSTRQFHWQIIHTLSWEKLP